MTIKFHPHALERIIQRGTTKEQVTETVERGERFEAKFGRTGFRRNFIFDKYRRQKYYRNIQVEVFAVKEDDSWLVISVITKYF
jgi:hypothetical protein